MESPEEDDQVRVDPESGFYGRKTSSLPHHYKIKAKNPQNFAFFKYKSQQDINNDQEDPRPVQYHPKPFSIVNPLEVKRRLEVITNWMSEFTSDQRTMALAAMHPYLGAAQFHWLSYKLPHQNLHSYCSYGCNDLFRILPLHLIYKIIGLLDPISLVRASQVNKKWHNIIESDWIWHHLAFTPPYQLSPQESHEQIERRRSLDHGKVCWKKVFKERFKLRKCWLKGQCHVRTFEGHTEAISCIQFDSSRIVTGSHDKTIRVWNIKTNSPWSVMTLTGHSGEVRCLHLEGNRVVSGSTDRTIKVWDLDIQPEWSSIGCKVTMVGHVDTVRCIHMKQDRNLVISGSYDATLKVWCLKTGNCLNTLQGHNERVLCLFWEQDDILLSGSTDKTIKIWSLQDGSCMQTLYSHSDAVTCLSREGEKIISGSLDRTIKIWNPHTGECLSTLDWMSAEGHTGVIRCLQADRWRIVSASDDKTIKVWCLETGQRLVTLRSHSDGVTCLRYNDFVIVSGSYDKTVKLWDFTVC